MKKYKIWVAIEEYDENTGEGHDIDIPELLGEAETVEQAFEIFNKIVDDNT
jgi:hypothetical protein